MSDEATNTPTAFGLELEPLDPDAIPLDAIVIVKCLDADGDTTIDIRSTDGLMVWDRVGMLTVALEVAKRTAADCWRPVDDADEGEDDS